MDTRKLSNEHIEAIVRLRSMREFQLLADVLLTARQEGLEDVAKADELSVIYRAQGSVRQVDELLDLFKGADELLRSRSRM